MSDYRTCRGAVAVAAGEPLQIREIEVPAPIADEILIRVVACGLCHSDLHYMDGTSGADFPYLVGHEISGVVEEIGPDVTRYGPGDVVIVSLVVSCQACEDCLRGRPARCQRKMPHQRRSRLPGGQELTAVLGAGGLAELMLIDEQHVAAKPASLDAMLSSLLGCGVATGYGAAVNTGEVIGGDNVAVIGCGGVGLSVISGAKAAAAASVTGFDFNPEKRALATEFGADTCVDPAANDWQSELAGTFDVVIDAVGGDGPLRQAISLARYGGRIVIAGAPRMDEVSEVTLRAIFAKRLEIHVSHWGDCVPDRDFPAIAELVASRGLPLDRYHTESVRLEDAPAAYERLRRGEVLRTIVTF